jgi:hypothetical protein
MPWTNCGFSVANLSRWAVHKINHVDPMDLLFTKKKKAVHPGPFNHLKAIEEPLLRYIFELRKQGQAFNTFVIVLRVSYMLPKFPCKELCSAMQRCKAILLCPFNDLSNGRTHIAAPAGQSQE